jgi:hypothetical protein
MVEQILPHFKQQFCGIAGVNVAVTDTDEKTDNQKTDDGGEKGKEELVFLA